MTNKTIRYTRALARWIKSGRPTRAEEEIVRIHDEICLLCDHYDPDRKSCNLCGCRINLSLKAYLNKIAMATEKCPKDKW